MTTLYQYNCDNWCSPQMLQITTIVYVCVHCDELYLLTLYQFIPFFLCSASCEFWDVKNPSSVTMYTLTVTAPDTEDWLLATPTSSDLSEPIDASQPDLHCTMITVGEASAPSAICSPWDSLNEQLSLPSKKRKDSSFTNSISRKPRIKNVDLETSLVFLRHNMTSIMGGNIVHALQMDNSKGESSCQEHRPVAIQVLLSNPSTSSSSPLSSSISALQTLQNHSLLNHIITSSNPQVLNCTLNSNSITATISANQTHSNSPNSFPNSSAVKNFKIPKKLSPIKSKPTPKLAAKSASRLYGVSPSALPHGLSATDSDEAVSSSVCLERKRLGLSTGPCSLCFTITNLSGCKWISYDLQGKQYELYKDNSN